MEHELTVNIPDIRETIIPDCEEILENNSFRYKKIDDETLRIPGFSTQVISQLIRNHSMYSSPLISVLLDITNDGDDVIISLHK